MPLTSKRTCGCLKKISDENARRQNNHGIRSKGNQKKGLEGSTSPRCLSCPSFSLVAELDCSDDDSGIFGVIHVDSINRGANVIGGY